MIFSFVSSLEIYKLIFTSELVIAEILATYSRKKKSRFILRAVLSIAAIYLIALLFPVAYYNPAYISLMFGCLFVCTLFALKFCYDESWQNVLFCGLLSYTVQHLGYELFLFLTFVFGLQTVGFYGSEALAGYDAYIWLIYFAVYSILYWFAWAFIEYPLRTEEDLKLKHFYFLLCAAVIIFVDIVLSAIVVYETEPIPYSLNWVVYMYSVVSCVFAIGMQFFMLKNQSLSNDIEMIKMLWKEDKKKYELTKENAELINVKCHDLQHRLADLKRMNFVDAEAISETEESIREYDSAIHTGNDVLDIILSRKILQARKEGITFACIVDGEALSFVSSTELYSLFENATSNAIEALCKVDDPEKKVIRLKVTRRDDIVVVHVENYCGEENLPQFKNGLPVTTKEDARYHGLGMRSMQMLTEKLGGGIRVCVEDGMFLLDIFFPYRQKK